jgi:hypothetical protein
MKGKAASLGHCQLVKDSGQVIPLYNENKVQFQTKLQSAVNLKYARTNLARPYMCGSVHMPLSHTYAI